MMKRSLSPGNDAGPSQKRPPKTQGVNKRKRCDDQVDTNGKVIWSGTVQSPDSQKIVFDCSMKAYFNVERMKSVFSSKQLNIHILPNAVMGALNRHIHVTIGEAILCLDENTDMVSYTAFLQAISIGKGTVGLALSGETASSFHLLFMWSFSRGHETRSHGFIMSYQRNDNVLQFLRSHGLLPCAHSEHQRLNQEQMDIHQKKIAEKEEELEKLHQDVMEQKRLAEKKQEELATSQNERDAMKKAIKEKAEEIIVKDITLMENDEALNRKDRELLSLQQKNWELQNEKEKVEEQLQRVLMKDQSWNVHGEINMTEDTDKILMMETSRLELENEVTMKKAALDEIGNRMDNDLKCSICSQLFIKTTTLNCSHSFCAFCIQKWLSEKGNCPHCRTQVTASVCCVVLDNLIETIIDKLGDEAKQRRKETVREREYDVSMQEGGHSIPEDVETDDEASTVTSPCSSLSHLSPSASLMSPYSFPPSSASTYWRSPASIANMFSPPSVLSTNSPSPAYNSSNN